MHSLDASSFWQYSVSRYSVGDTAPVALVLQDNHGVNVNVLLLLCWCLENNVVINLMQLKKVIDAASLKDEHLIKHREMRKAAHPDNGGNALRYDALKQEELALEKQQQADIIEAFTALEVASLPSGASMPNSGVLNASIASFINAYGLRDSAEARQLLSHLVKQLS